MNIVFCVNKEYRDILSVVLFSTLENNTQDFIQFYIITTDFDDNDKKHYDFLKKKYKNFNITYLKPKLDKLKNLKLTIDYISRETYFRYLIAELLPQESKALYLDADIIVNGSLKELYEKDINDYYFAGVKDLYIEHLGYKPSSNFAENDLYINAGVLLCNLQKMKTDNLANKLIENSIRYSNTIKYQDQDVINITCRGKIKEIESIYNFTSANAKYEKDKSKQAIIIHYTGKNKPWLSKHRIIHKLKRDIKYIWIRYYEKNLKLIKKKIKVGLLIDEFFGGAGTAFGGYGFLARKYIAKYIPDENIKIDVLLGRGKRKLLATKFHEDNVDLYKLPKFSFAAKYWLKKQNYDVYLSIELTTDYVLKNETNSNKKLILWIQDPRPKYEWDEIETVQLFKEYNYYRQEIYDTVHNWNEQGRVKFISQGFFLNTKAIDLYRLPQNVSIQYLPNPVDIDKSFNVKTYLKKDNIIFLGRIESVKRGWLFCEIAKQMPEYSFYMLGQSFREKDKNLSIMEQYQNISNLHFVGHVDGKEKEQYLKEAKILVNTSIHEALPISFLEALAYGVCLVSNRNPENLTEKFGIWTGQINGDGFDKLDLYVKAIKTLMINDDMRQQCAIEGRAYVERIHNVNRFIKDIKENIYNLL